MTIALGLGIATTALAKPAAQQQVAVATIDGDKGDKIHDALVAIAGKAKWKAVDTGDDAADATIDGKLIQKKGRAAHLAVAVRDHGKVVASVDLRLGRTVKLDARNKKKLSKQLVAALAKIKPRAQPAEPPPVAAAEPPSTGSTAIETKPAVMAADPPRSSGKPGAQVVDDEMPKVLKH